MIFSLHFIKIIIEIGKAIKLPKKIDRVPRSGSSIKPKRNSILISPPPRDSFLNNLLPRHMIKYISTNRKAPVNKW